MLPWPLPELVRNALESIADNVAYIRGELAALKMPDELREEILAACARFDPIVKKVEPGESAGAAAPIWDALGPMQEQAELYVFGKDADGLLSTLESLHTVVMRLFDVSKANPGLRRMSILVAESATNILQAHAMFHAAMRDASTN